ncbi:hypothetical protein Syun_019892 [Stephania yunnanensis]|uniref:Uncharacterized protein n=1 Tax=Stephania yunnanensis TaxID=152371 RepID=A0AAP0NYD8_9MAGN
MDQRPFKAENKDLIMYDDHGEDCEKNKCMVMMYMMMRTSTYMACLSSIMMCITGGLLLALWAYQFSSSNSQLWMVPFGLILSVTPIVVWLSLFVSSECTVNHDNLQQDDLEK